MRYSAAEREIIAAAQRVRMAHRKEAKASRTKSPKADRGRERDNGFLAFLRRQPCEAASLGGCSGPIEAAHVSYRVAGIPNSFGKGVKNHDRHATPLCNHHHINEQHKMGERDFWASIGKDAYETAALHYAAYKAQ